MELATIDAVVKATNIGKIGSSKIGRHKNCPKGCSPGKSEKFVPGTGELCIRAILNRTFDRTRKASIPIQSRAFQIK